MELLKQLAARDVEAWNEVFRHIYPVAFEAARLRLGETLSNDCEDVAIETLADLVERVVHVNSEAELKPLAVAIARNKATDRLRRHLAQKRGANRGESLEAMLESGNDGPAATPGEEALDRLTIQELRELLTLLASEVKREYRVVLRDHFFDQLSYTEIAEKRTISVGSVGVYVQRGIAALRNVIARKPKLQAEFLEALSDAGAVRLLLPLLSAVQLGGWVLGQSRFSLNPIDETKLTDEDRLRRDPETLPKEERIGNTQSRALTEKLQSKYPAQFALWQQQKMKERWRKLRGQFIVCSVLVAVTGAVVYGLVRLVRWIV